MDRNYELVVILDPELKTEEQEKLLSKIKKLISTGEGKISELKEWGKKELAYRIAKKTNGIFCLLFFSAPVASISSLKQKLQLEEKILRFLVVVADERR